DGATCREDQRGDEGRRENELVHGLGLRRSAVWALPCSFDAKTTRLGSDICHESTPANGDAAQAVASALPLLDHARRIHLPDLPSRPALPTGPNGARG